MLKMLSGQTEPCLSASFHQYQTLGCRSFWRAGSEDYLTTLSYTLDGNLEHSDLERARVHPKFLHSNATSHKWAFGAIAELIDNAVDEICNGATFIKVDRVLNLKDNSPALLFQDDGGGMDPDGIRRCMSLGFSSKKTTKTIGQYGNGFKTSTMRLGADAIVFSCSSEGNCSTQSIGLLSSTYLTITMKNDIVVPIIDFEVVGDQVVPLVHGLQDDWNSCLKIILDWSPFSSKDELMIQLKDIGSHGTKVFVYNLWYDDDGLLELDFDDDDEDIRLRNRSKSSARSELCNEMIQSHISYTFQYSLRAYASILYLRKFTKFSIILRGKPVQQVDIASELKFAKKVKYRPHIGKETVKTVIGFAKEAPLLGIYGFNVYHKNRLIIPFWRVFHEGGNRGKSVIGVLEANFIEPAHDKQDFERSPLFNRLEAKLKQIILEYWKTCCHLIGYKLASTVVGSKRNHSSVLQGTSADQPASSYSNLPGPNLQDRSLLIPPGTDSAASCQGKSLVQPIVGLEVVNASRESCASHVSMNPSVLEGISFEDNESNDLLDSTMIDKISEENVILFMKREEYKSRWMQLKQLIEKYEEELVEVRTKCKKLASELEIQKKQRIVCN